MCPPTARALSIDTAAPCQVVPTASLSQDRGHSKLEGAPRGLIQPVTLPPHSLCSPGALPQGPGSLDLTSGGSQEDSEEHRPPAQAVGLRDLGDAHFAVGQKGVWCSQIGAGLRDTQGNSWYAGSRQTPPARKLPAERVK